MILRKVKLLISKNEDKNLKFGPDFLCIGAQKAATSWLNWNLTFHPETEMPPEKEINFFYSRSYTLWERFFANLYLLINPNLNTGKVKWIRKPILLDKYIQWRLRYRVFYEERKKVFLSFLGGRSESTFPYRWWKKWLFSQRTIENYFKLFYRDENKITGDMSPENAFLSNEWIELLYKKSPNLKIIYIIRNPIERTWSQFKMNNKDFLLTNPKENKIIEHINNNYYFSCSSYIEVLNNWETYFPRRIKVLFYEQICENPEKAFIEVCNYLNISPNIEFNNNLIKEKIFEGYSHPIPISVRKFLNNYFKEEITSLHKRFNNVYTQSWINSNIEEAIVLGNSMNA